MQKYAASYSASVDPFAAWRAKAAEERRASMGIHDRCATHVLGIVLPTHAVAAWEHALLIKRALLSGGDGGSTCLPGNLGVSGAAEMCMAQLPWSAAAVQNAM